MVLSKHLRTSRLTRRAKNRASVLSTVARCASVFILLTFAIVQIGFGQSDESRTESAKEDEAQTVGLEEAPLKWLPDVKTLVGAPATVINLEETAQQLCEQGKLGDANANASDVEWVSAQCEGDAPFVDVQLDGSKLALNWRENMVGKTTVIVKGALKDSPEHSAAVSFHAEVWKPNYLAILMAVIGGGGLFLLGMKRMSDGLQAMAGSRLRRLVSLFTNNRVLAVGVGALVTTLVQSSTATTVMTLGFVNSGLMTLTQATGVLLGANIGTTTTGWLFALNMGALGLPILGVAALFYLFCKKETIRNVSTFLLGLGMIFFGLETLKSGLAPLPETPQFSWLMLKFQATSLSGAFMCVLIGCVATAVAHSSAATLAITMTLASLGAIDLNSSAAIVLGSNVGTTLTPAIVAIGAPANTRRAAYFHIVFNTIGIVWALAIFFPIFMPAVNGLGDFFNMNITGRIALTHTLFNVANTLIFVPLLGPVCRTMERLVTDKGDSGKPTTTGLSSFFEDEPTLGVERSRLEVQRMFLECRSLIENLKTLHADGFEDETLISKSFEIEKKLDSMQDETIDFISRLTPRAFSTDVAASAREQIRVAEELETLSDYLVGLMKSNLKLKNQDLSIPEEQSANFAELLAYAVDSLEWLEKSFAERKHFHLAAPMNARRRQYIARAKEIRETFVQDMFNERIDPLVIIAVDYQLNAWRRVYEHLQNIADALETPGVALNPGLKKTAKA